MPPAVAAAAIGAGGMLGSTLLNKKSQGDAQSNAYKAQQEQAQKDYNMKLWRFNEGMKRYDLKKGLIQDFANSHGLKMSPAEMAFLNGPDPTAPAFGDIGGATNFGSTKATDYSGIGDAVTKAGAKLFAPKADDGGGGGGDYSQPGPNEGPQQTPPTPATPAVDMGALLQGANLEDPTKGMI